MAPGIGVEFNCVSTDLFQSCSPAKFWFPLFAYCDMPAPMPFMGYLQSACLLLMSGPAIAMMPSLSLLRGAAVLACQAASPH